MNRWSWIFVALSVSSNLACGASNDDKIQGPKFQAVAPAGGSGGESGEAGAGGFTPSGDPEACGGDGLVCCGGTTCESDLVCEGGTCGVPGESSSPTPSPDPAPSGGACGANGGACCQTGEACSGGGGKAQCCTECGGAPDYLCQCDSGFKAGGLCKVCCVICKDGHKKVGPQLVGEQESCQQAAIDWCQTNRNTGADEGSGWRNSCD